MDPGAINKIYHSQIDYLENPTIRTVHSVEKLTEIDDHSNHYMKTSITRTFNRTNSHSNIDDSTKNQQSNLNIEIKNCQHFQRHPPDTDLKNKLTLPTCKFLSHTYIYTSRCFFN